MSDPGHRVRPGLVESTTTTDPAAVTWVLIPPYVWCQRCLPSRSRLYTSVAPLVAASSRYPSTVAVIRACAAAVIVHNTRPVGVAGVAAAGEDRGGSPGEGTRGRA